MHTSGYVRSSINWIKSPGVNEKVEGSGVVFGGAEKCNVRIIHGLL